MFAAVPRAGSQQLPWFSLLRPWRLSQWSSHSVVALVPDCPWAGGWLVQVGILNIQGFFVTQRAFLDQLNGEVGHHHSVVLIST